MSEHVLVTGGAGFIGSHLVDRLLAEGRRVTVLDNFDPFYEPHVKRRNIERHIEHPAYRLIEGDLRDDAAMEARLPHDVEVVIHLAAKAGVRPSIADPMTYQDVNVRGTHALLELCRRRGIRRFVFGSSSSVYGVNPRVPWHEEDTALQPVSPYASTKASGELLGHVYSTLYGIRFIALRFFTVYGPRQRPDLAIHRFARLMLAGQPIPVFGDGSARRDFTYVSDIVSGIIGATEYDASAYEVFNLGNDSPVTLAALIEELERALGVDAKIDRLAEQAGDVPQTWASIDKARALLGYGPSVPLVEGLERFANWIRPQAHEVSSRLAAVAR